MKNNHVISLSFAENIPKNPFQDKIAKSSYSSECYTFFGTKPTQIDVIQLSIIFCILKHFSRLYKNYDFLLIYQKKDKNSNTENLIF